MSGSAELRLSQATRPAKAKDKRSFNFIRKVVLGRLMQKPLLSGVLFTDRGVRNSRAGLLRVTRTSNGDQDRWFHN